MVISTETNLVELAATVRDAKDRPIAGLRSSDFEVLDNNQPRTITFFSEHKANPADASEATARTIGAPALGSLSPVNFERSIALFFDDAHASMLGVRKSAEAAQRLIDGVIAPGDLVGIFTSSGTVSLDFTKDRAALLKAVAQLRPRPFSGVNATTQCPALSSSDAYIITHHQDIAIEDAAVAKAVACNCFDPSQLRTCTLAQREVVRSVAQNVWLQFQYQSTTTLDALLAIARHLAAAPGERMMIIMSPGFPTGGMEERTSAVTDLALRANIRISALNSEGLLADLTASRRLFLLSGFMADAARSTAGTYLHDTNDWIRSLHKLLAVPEVSYVLGFSLPSAPDGKYHSLRTRIRGRRNYHVDSRPGYYALAPEQRETAQQRIARIAMSSEVVKDFPVTLRLQQQPTRDGETSLLVAITVDAEGLRFAEKEGRQVQELAFLTILEDERGNFIAGKESVMDMALSASGQAGMLKNGIHAVTSVPVSRPGSYRVREVVRELIQNRLWASFEPIQIQ